MFWLRNKKNIFRYTLLSGVLLMLDPIYEIWKKSVEKCYVSTKKKGPTDEQTDGRAEN